MKTLILFLAICLSGCDCKDDRTLKNYTIEIVDINNHKDTTVIVSKFKPYLTDTGCIIVTDTSETTYTKYHACYVKTFNILKTSK